MARSALNSDTTPSHVSQGNR